jgi:hypothetical protein
MRECRDGLAVTADPVHSAAREGPAREEEAVAEDRLNQLEGRLERIEKALGSRMQREPVDLSADELQAYIKVRDVIAADWGDFCGINDCFRCTLCRSCSVCLVCQVCRLCDVECICGPCGIRGAAGGGIRDFRQFGG